MIKGIKKLFFKKTHNIVGATLGWSGKIQLCFEDGKIFYSPEVDRVVYPEYFKDGEEWPIDPKTGKKLPERIRGCLV